ncbi:hypothetical protein LGIDLPPJ_00043 [Klebsiella phage KP13-27]|nr:hypothetical protein LGIDLPPJ_00043 [Klebsiella phage KP13-27]
MKDDRYELAERNGMSKEFIDWFFDKKKSDCGTLWFMTMAVMWEGWKASREQLVVELPERLSPVENNPEYYMVPDPEGDYLNRDEVIEVLKTAGITVKSD